MIVDAVELHARQVVDDDPLGLLELCDLRGVGFAAAAASGPINSPLTVPGTESQRAFDLIEQRFPGSAADGATARVLFQAPAGQRLTTSANAAAVPPILPRSATSTNPSPTSGG